MDRKYFKYTLFFLSLPLLSFKPHISQNILPDISAFTDEIKIAANTGIDAAYLTQEEKQVLFYVNLARLAPADFYSILVAPRYEERDSKYIKSLKKTLLTMKPVLPLGPHLALYQVANKHALDMGKSGRIGHQGTKNKSFSKRVKLIQQEFPEGLSENCQYGNDTPLEIVLDLLVDDGVPSLGHRRSLLSGRFNYAGIAIQPHKIYTYNCVIDLGAK